MGSSRRDREGGVLMLECPGVQDAQVEGLQGETLLEG
jgi:hypothetical protein